MKFEIKTKLLKNVSKTKLKKVNGIVLHLLPQLYGKFSAQWEGHAEIVKMNHDLTDFGFHYGIDQYDIVNYIDIKNQAKSIKNGATYISTALFDQKPEAQCLSVIMFINETHNYEITEKYIIRFIVKLLRDNKLESKHLWRGFDLSKENKDPLHMLNLDIFKAYLEQIDEYIKVTDPKLTEEKQTEIDDKVKFESPFKLIAEKEKLTINDYIKKFYLDNKDNVDKYASSYMSYDKDLEEIKNFKQEATSGELTVNDLSSGNKIQFKITQHPPKGGCSCAKATDSLESIETTKETMVEPIYPDLITPPGGDISIANGNSETATQNNSNTPLTIEEFEKRQKTFSMENFKDVKKSTVGRPINCDDPFPVDAQIKKLEDHYPKVKIDKVRYAFTEDNHLGSELGEALAKNYNMTYDMVCEVSKRTEQRLVKIENNLSTVMRNLFRMSSRVNINCIYYGGQSIFGMKKLNY